MNNIQDTPRVDDEASDGWSGDAECVSSDFARTLKRELNEAKSKSQLLNGCHKHRNWNGVECIGCIEDERNQLRSDLKMCAEALLKHTHKPNPNDEGRECLCENCKLIRNSRIQAILNEK